MANANGLRWQRKEHFEGNGSLDAKAIKSFDGKGLSMAVGIRWKGQGSFDGKAKGLSRFDGQSLSMGKILDGQGLSMANAIRE